MPNHIPVSIVAKKLGCSDPKVRYLIKRGELKAVKKGTTKVEKKSLEHYLKGGKKLERID
jgi:excisionase family DNA binding protein